MNKINEVIVIHDNRHEGLYVEFYRHRKRVYCPSYHACRLLWKAMDSANIKNTFIHFTRDKLEVEFVLW